MYSHDARLFDHRVHPRSLRLSIGAVLLLGLALTACSSEDGDKKSSSSPIKAGTCIAKEVPDEGDKAPDLSSVVACSEPHVYEIVDVVDLPKDALNGQGEQEQLANRKDLAELFKNLEESNELSAEAEAYLDFIDQGACDAAVLTMTGYDEIQVDGADAREIDLAPLFSTIQVGAINVMPEKQWLDGNRQLMCSARFVEPITDFDTQFSVDRALKPVSSKNGKPVLSTAAEPAFSAAWRQCTIFLKGEDFNSPTGCDQQHYSESLFVFNADGVMDGEILSSIEQPEEEPTKKQAAELDRVCETAIPSVMAEGFERRKSERDLRVIGMPGTPWEDEAKYVTCELVAVQSKTTDLGPGSLVWTDARKPKLIDVG